jgi:nucleoside-diphosphate-sugar epimerase
MKASVAVTGASGFIGSSLVKELAARQFNVHQVPRCSVEVEGAQCLIHCAARTHIMRGDTLAPLSDYRRVNVHGTLNLARRAAVVGVKRFLFLSSVKVNGESTDGLPCCSVSACSNDVGSRRFARDDEPRPEDAYGISKWEAEQGLWKIASQTGMEVVVVRPSLVYGPGVKGNFARLLNLVRSGVPLPLAAVDNRRSFIGIDNLLDLLIRCVDHPKVAGQTLLVSDGQDLSTPELLGMIAKAMGRPARLFPVPVPLLRLTGLALGRLNEVDRLVGSLQVDSSATCELLGWTPPVSVEEGIKRMVA